MFALADPGRIRGILAGAAWHDIEITPVHTPILVGGEGTIDDAVEFLRTGSLGRTMLADRLAAALLDLADGITTGDALRAAIDQARIGVITDSTGTLQQRGA